MGARIEAASALTSHGMRKPSARRLADDAAKACLAHAGKPAGDVDMLINAGIYREDNMGEPALAALIQEDIGANLGQPPIGGHGTFSFDLMNGTCGVISAIQLQAGFLRSGVIQLGLIVTSDVHPNPKDAGANPSGRPAARCSSAGMTASPGSRTSTLRRFPSTRTCSRASITGRRYAGRTAQGGRPATASWSSTGSPDIWPVASIARWRRPGASFAAWEWASRISTCSSPPLPSRTSWTS